MSGLTIIALAVGLVLLAVVAFVVIKVEAKVETRRMTLAEESKYEAHADEIIKDAREYIIARAEARD